MTDLYQINEILQKKPDNELKTNHPNACYQSDTNHLSTINLFIKAVQKALDQVNKSIEIIDSINENEAKDPKLMVEFAKNLTLAGQIMEEFQKGTAILYDDTPNLVNLFNKLNDAFTIVRMRISMFAITKDKKYSFSAIETLNIILLLFQNIKKSTQETLNPSENFSENAA